MSPLTVLTDDVRGGGAVRLESSFPMQEYVAPVFTIKACSRLLMITGVVDRWEWWHFCLGLCSAYRPLCSSVSLIASLVCYSWSLFFFPVGSHDGLCSANCSHSIFHQSYNSFQTFFCTSGSISSAFLHHHFEEALSFSQLLTDSSCHNKFAGTWMGIDLLLEISFII